MNQRSTTVTIGFITLIGGALALWLLRPLDPGVHYGPWSLLPAAITIAVCFFTRNVLLALLLGIFTGGLVIGRLNVIDAFLIPSLATENYAQILLVYLWALGGLLGLWNANGGAHHFANRLAQRFVRTRTSAKVFAWLLGVLFHQGGTISTVLAGTTVRGVADQQGVAHEELAYVVDSTASPIATLIPFNVWPIYIAGLITIEPLAEIAGTEGAAVAMFLSAIPFNFYAIIAVSMTFLFALDRLPLFKTPMSRVVQRVRTTGELNAPTAQPIAAKELTDIQIADGYSPSMLDFLVPIGVLLGFCIIPWLLEGSPMVFEGFGSAVIAALVVSIGKGMSITAAFTAVINGIKGVTVGAVVLGLAVTLATVSSELGTSSYVIATAAPALENMPYLLPSLLMLICMIVAFSIGSSWGTYAVVFPVALPLALALSPDPTYISLTFGAILGGAVFGDQCSPISDTTILSSLACGADLMDHVTTQLPLALIAAGIASLGYLLLGLSLF